MVKLLLFPFALILAFVSAQADDKFYISDANKTVYFTASSYTALASWTSDINNKITFEGFRNLRNKPQRQIECIYNSIESNTWNLFEIVKRNWGVKIYPGKRRYEVDWSYGLDITITSTKKTYWRFCADIFKCDLPAPVHPVTEFPVGPTPSPRETALEITTIVSLSICCVLVAIVIGMAVCLIRGRRTSLIEPARNLEPENTSHNPQMFNVNTFSSQQEDHESINSLYGVTINRESPQ
ncbi:uncharacterized protein [Palaemon carinicauda]|uniref:uncharacterized protein n=1 Tax=Palaemon carinicauda TaxID=392227 RepID=UPI0035B664D5